MLSFQLEFRKVWFEGVGYLKLKPQRFKYTNFSVIFLLRTTDRNSFVMDIEELARFVLNDGYINVIVKDQILSSKFKVNDDESHVVELIKRNLNCVLKIDGIRAEKREIVPDSLLESARIYIGGIPNIINADEYLNGEVSDMFIDK